VTAAADIAAGLNGRRNGRGWVACCPAHDDKHPSLSIDEGRDGKALVVCRTGCSQDDVIDALRGLGLWPEAPDLARATLRRPVGVSNITSPAHNQTPGQHDAGVTPAPPTTVIVPGPDLSPPDFKALLGKEPTDYWDYLDAAGAPLGYTVRTEGPDGKKEMRPVTWCNGAWKVKAFSEPRPLYGLAHLAERPDVQVLIVEGEKTAVAASKLFDDFVVVTWPGGCGAVGKADWRVLDGRTVTVWPDADEPGLKAASEVADRLPGATVVILPEGLPKGWDLADDISAGMDVEGLLNDARASPGTEALDLARATLTYPSEWTDPPPPRQWLVENWIPWGTVTALYGDGGMGKSLLCQQLLTCAATGNDWLGMAVTQAKSLAVFCEDPQEEHQRRQWDINALYQTSPGEVTDLAFMHRFGQPDNAMMIFPHRDAQGEATVFYRQVLDAAKEFGAKVVLLDSLHNLFAGDENARPQALQFVQALASIAIEIDGVVLLTGHPSLSGLSTGAGTSGSTAWSNAVRSRLYLSRPEKQGTDDVDPNEKVLRVMKANYAPVGDGIRLTWGNGVLNYHPEEMGVDASATGAKAQRVFMTLLATFTNEGLNASANPNAGKLYAPVLCMKREPNERDGLGKKELERAMWKLLKDGKIEPQTTGPASRKQTRLIIIEPN